MKKIITQDQINAVLNLCIKDNVPVQSFLAAKDMFDKLPEFNEKNGESNNSKS